MGLIVLAATQEEDYVTEKFAQALTAGSVPVVIGAPNIEDFAVAPQSMIVLRSKEASPSLLCNPSRLLALQIFPPHQQAAARHVGLRNFSLQLSNQTLQQSKTESN